MGNNGYTVSQREMHPCVTLLGGKGANLAEMTWFGDCRFRRDLP